MPLTANIAYPYTCRFITRSRSLLSSLLGQYNEVGHEL